MLNASNGSGKPEEFNLKDIEVIVNGKEQNWFRRAHVGKFLGLVHIHISMSKLTDEDQKTWAFLQAGMSHYDTPQGRCSRSWYFHLTYWCPLCHCKLLKRQG